MATPLFSNNNNYGPQMPSSQGQYGQQGASGISSPEQIGAQQYRASLYQPPPSSTQQPSKAQMPPSGQYQTNQAAPPSNGSPVNANGMIMQSSTPAPPQGQTGQQAQSQWTVDDYNAGRISGDPARGWAPQDWVDYANKYNPKPASGQPGQPPQQGAPPTGAQPNPALYSPYGPYPGRPDGTVYQPGQVPQYNFQPYQTAQFGQIPNSQMPTYQAGNFSQFQAPDQSAQTAQQNALMSQLMSNPGWGADAVNQMKAGQKDSALSMQQQQQQQLQQGAAGRGMLNSGFELGQERRLADTTQQNILGGYRDIDVANAQNSFQNQLAALSAQNDVLNGQASRASSLYNSGLQGQQAQEAARQAQAQSGQNATQFGLQQALAQNSINQSQADENFRGFQSQFLGPQFNQNSFMQQQQLNQAGAQSGLAGYNTDINAFQNYQGNQSQNRQLDIQSQLGNAGIGVDQQRLAEQGREFNSNSQLNWAQLLNNMYLGRAGLGLDYASLQNTAQNQMMQTLFGNMLGG